jgi:hypothetical protein
MFSEHEKDHLDLRKICISVRHKFLFLQKIETIKLCLTAKRQKYYFHKFLCWLRINLILCFSNKGIFVFFYLFTQQSTSNITINHNE